MSTGSALFGIFILRIYLIKHDIRQIPSNWVGFLKVDHNKITIAVYPPFKRSRMYGRTCWQGSCDYEWVICSVLRSES